VKIINKARLIYLGIKLKSIYWLINSMGCACQRVKYETSDSEMSEEQNLD